MTLPITLGGYFYHVLNRANGQLRIFRKPADLSGLDAQHKKAVKLKMLGDNGSTYQISLSGVG